MILYHGAVAILGCTLYQSKYSIKVYDIFTLYQLVIGLPLPRAGQLQGNPCNSQTTVFPFLFNCLTIIAMLFTYLSQILTSDLIMFFS